MSRHSARLVDLGIALATCAAFSAAILGDIAANNIDAIIASDFPRPLYALLAFNSLLCIAGYLLGWRYFLYVWPLALFLLFRFGNASTQIGSFLLPVVREVPEWVDLLWIAPMLSGAALLFILLLWMRLLRHKMHEPRRAAWMLLFFSLGATYPSLDETSILLREARQPVVEGYLAASQDIQDLGAAKPVQPLPDIIMLVPDRYPSNRTLREAFGYTNDAFSTALAERGFVVLEDLRANYQMTLMSLVSSMNLQIFDIERVVPLTHLYAGMRWNLLAQTLLQNGYEYVHLGGWFGATMRNPLADRIYNGIHYIGSYLTELEIKLLMQTPIFGAYITFTEGEMDAEGHMNYECRRLKRQLQYLRALKRSDKPLFVWAHIYIPHQPLTMDADGNCLPVPVLMPGFKSEEEMHDKEKVSEFMSAVAEYRKMFLGYMEAFNREALAIFDAQQQQSREHGRELIFGMLSDEGSYPILWAAIKDGDLLYERSASHVLREKFGIFGAIHANHIKRSDICSLRSRVNVWRMILGSILAVDLPPADDVAQMLSGRTKAQKNARYLGSLRSVHDRLGNQLLGGIGCEGVLGTDSSAPAS